MLTYTCCAGTHLLLRRFCRGRNECSRVRRRHRFITFNFGWYPCTGVVFGPVPAARVVVLRRRCRFCFGGSIQPNRSSWLHKGGCVVPAGQASLNCPRGGRGGGPECAIAHNTRDNNLMRSAEAGSSAAPRRAFAVRGARWPAAPAQFSIRVASRYGRVVSGKLPVSKSRRRAPPTLRAGS